jgi:uncharacterized membrane protein
MVAEIMPLDYWTLFVNYVFGGFWIAVIGLAFLFFIIMGPLGKISIYTVQWYIVLFVLTMTLGYGYALVVTFLNLLILLYFISSTKGAIDAR